MPEISIIIPCRNERAHIESCLKSILGQEQVPGGFEVIVADGMSEDGTRTILQRVAALDSRVRMVDNPERTTSHGLNQAIRASRGEFIIRMDAHTEYASSYVRECIDALRGTGADNVGGPARTKYSGNVQGAICAAYHSPFSVGGARFHNVAYEGYVDTVTYGCWRRQLFERIGYFDEELVRNQDDEFNLRIVRAGGKIWQSPRIESWYRPRASLKSLFHQYMQYGYWKVRILQKHKIPASVRHLVPGAFLLGLALLLAGAPFWPPAFWMFAVALGAYAAASVFTSVLLAARNGWRLLPLLPVVFACFHFGYGAGFLRGVWDFLVLRRRPGSSLSRLTRPATS